MAADKVAPKNHDTSPARRIEALRRRLAALREGKQPGADKAGHVSWPRNLNEEKTAPGEWGPDAVEAGRE